MCLQNAVSHTLFSMMMEIVQNHVHDISNVFTGNNQYPDTNIQTMPYLNIPER